MRDSRVNSINRIVSKIQQLWKEKAGLSDAPDLNQYSSEASLVLLNSHPSVEPPVPYTPNVIEVGGIHLTPTRPLPQDIAKMANDSGDTGFIIFGLGSIVNPSHIDERYFRLFVEAFSKIPQTVFWKFSGSEEDWKPPVPIPSNVKLVKWLPQADLLAHPKCKGFITHGGKLSIIEAISNAVPVIVIPFFADQDMHAYLAAKDGYGLYLDIQEITTDSFHGAIKDIVENPSYRQVALYRSHQLLKDLPDSPLDRALYWTEYVIRHKGAPHLRPEARHMTWWQFHLVDVWATVFATISVIITMLVVSVKFVFSRFLSTSYWKHNKKE